MDNRRRQWILEKGFNVDDDLRQQLVEGLSSNEDTVSVLFGKTGVSSVTLRNVYDKPVALEDGSLRAIQDETTGDWVITKKFEVNVYGGLEPRFKITNMATGETMDEKSESITWTIEAGQKIKVEDLTESDRPDARTWNVEGSSEKHQQKSLRNLLLLFRVSILVSHLWPNVRSLLLWQSK